MQTRKLTFEDIPSSIQLLSEQMTNLEKLVIEGNNNSKESTPIETEPLIYGITGLSKFLQVSLPTAQKIKNSGKIPFSQAERTIIFRKVEVLEALSNKKKRS